MHYKKWRRGELEASPRYKTCCEENCNKPLFKKGYCEPHYSAWSASKKGETGETKPAEAPTAEAAPTEAPAEAPAEKPAEAAPAAEEKPAEAAPAEAPAEEKKAEEKPAEEKPAEEKKEG